MKKCDVLIVGAGFAGMVLAERLSNELGKHCVIVDKRPHIGGNAHDYVDDAGVLVHKYGAHLFHTNSDHVMHYLSKFTSWTPTVYSGSSFTHGQLWSFPLNLKTFEQWTGHASTTEEFEKFLSSVRVQLTGAPLNAEEAVISQVGWKLYQMFYKGYTQKQWGRDPRELNASVCQRVPIRTTRNDVWFNDIHQCMPTDGYAKLFNRMLAACTGIELWLNTDWRAFRHCVEYKHLVYTGPIDEFFNYEHGTLPYRSLRFEHESFCRDQLMLRSKQLGHFGFYQPTTQVSYPNSEEFTRIIEIKHATGQKCRNTTIVKEYPLEHKIGMDPYYPIPSAAAASQYARYKEMADATPNTSFVGRLARYSYYNMDQVVAQALTEFKKLKERL